VAAEAENLRAYLQQHLPQYMVPAAFVLLDALPLTANNKIDVAALRRRNPSDSSYARPVYEAPQTAMENALAQHWAQLLNLERVGRHDSFLALGGHSLLALRVSNFVRQEFGVEIELACLFTNPSVAQLGEHISLALDAKKLSGSRQLIGAETDVEEGTF
jgi:arthrofactin-type cyclic lipopeptide synthetase C